MAVNDDELQLFAEVVARASSDDDFRAKLTADPRAVLTEAGINVPEGKTINVVQNTANESYLVLPDPETAGDELLTRSSGGATGCSACSMTCW